MLFWCEIGVGRGEGGVVSGDLVYGAVIEREWRRALHAGRESDWCSFYQVAIGLPQRSGIGRRKSRTSRPWGKPRQSQPRWRWCRCTSWTAFRRTADIEHTPPPGGVRGLQSRQGRGEGGGVPCAWCSRSVLRWSSSSPLMSSMLSVISYLGLRSL